MAVRCSETRCARDDRGVEKFGFGCVRSVDIGRCRGIATTSNCSSMPFTDEGQPYNVDNALRVGILYRHSPHPLPRIFRLCGTKELRVLGTTNPAHKPMAFNPGHLYAYTDPLSPFPQIYCPVERKVAVQVIIFDRPSPTKMQYMSLHPISLALGDKPSQGGVSLFSSSSTKVDAAKARLVEKLRLHTVVKHAPTSKEVLLPIILTQINCSLEIAQLLAKNVHLIGVRPKRSQSVSERVVESANSVWDYVALAVWYALTTWIWPLLTRIFVVGLICHRVVAEIVLCVLEWRLHAESAALKDVSATAQQIDIRLQQFCYWPIQYTALRKRRDDWESVTDRNPDYIRFYNSLWLVANDVIIGIALGSYIIDNTGWVVAQIDDVLTGWTVVGLQRMITWLMDWPAGLKLNNELAAFLGDLFLWVIDYWSSKSIKFLRISEKSLTILLGCVDSFRPLLPHIIHFIGFSSFAGASMPIAMFSDMLSLLTIHIYSFYTASARIYYWQWTIIISLFHLFRGKKHNVLRNRIDSCDYDLDQLLLGTILFTLLFFLLPTVLVFYLTFASARMIIISLKAALDALLACLNHFPLFALMLRVKDSRRLPGWSLSQYPRLRALIAFQVVFFSSCEIPPVFHHFLMIRATNRQPHISS